MQARFERGKRHARPLQDRSPKLPVKNDLPEANIIHWHGLHVPQVMDGHPMYDVPPGSGYVYEFQVVNRAGTYIYHAHTHEATGRHVYMGLASLIIVTDPEEKALDLPAGEFDQPIVLQDRSFDADNRFRYVQTMRDRHMGFLGDEILVNGKREFVLPVATRAYRLRFLNGSNSRIYKLGWEDGAPLTVIGVDGGLLEKPVVRLFAMLAPGERLEIWADFTGRELGAEMTMKSLPFSGVLPGHGDGMMGGRGMMGGMRHGGDGRRGPNAQGAGEGGHGMMGGMGMMGDMGHRGESGSSQEDRNGMGRMGGMMNASAIPLGSEYPLFKIRVAREEKEERKLPERLTNIERLWREQAENAHAPRTIKISMGHMKWLLNGRDFEMTGAAPEEVVKLNSLQVIEFDNGYSEGQGMGMMGMMGMAHPMHIHGQQFQILERVVREDRRKDYDSVAPGFVDEGWKDVVLVLPGEKVTLLKRFDDYTGLFLYHCHNLEHEELGMMRNFKVV
jgi:suppressor of ftsI